LPEFNIYEPRKPHQKADIVVVCFSLLIYVNFRLKMKYKLYLKKKTNVALRFFESKTEFSLARCKLLVYEYVLETGLIKNNFDGSCAWVYAFNKTEKNKIT